MGYETDRDPGSPDSFREYAQCLAQPLGARCQAVLQGPAPVLTGHARFHTHIPHAVTTGQQTLRRQLSHGPAKLVSQFLGAALARGDSGESSHLLHDPHGTCARLKLASMIR